VIIVALGSNINGPWGSPRETLFRAVRALEARGVAVLAMSSLIKTAPMGPADQPDFINAVCVVRTGKSPDALLRTLHDIEKRAGRVRRQKWGPRTLDLDLVSYNQVRWRSRRGLPTLPHPGISSRQFVLAPLLEIAPRWRHPATGQTAAFMLQQLCRLKQP
jgi:2-amino-4-hydroxy-6-hydroxymethyldihydropteridine diphosphokinase